MSWYIKVLKNYAVFSGRAQPMEYWFYLLISFLIYFAINFVAILLGMNNNLTEMVSLIYNLAVFIPTIAVGVRRMHDTNHSGWWLLFPVVNLIFACNGGDQGTNSYGPDPKMTPATRY